MRTQSDRDPQQLELFGHRRVTAGRVFFGRARARFNRWLTWYSALSRPGVYAVQTAAVLIGLMVYGGVLLGIWHRGVASDMKRALAHSTNLPASSPKG